MAFDRVSGTGGPRARRTAGSARAGTVGAP
jgi:hypothetical protein